MKKKIAFAMIMGVVTTGVISLTLISINIGFKPNFFLIWLRSWFLAYVIVIPCILLIAPRIERMVEYLFKQTNNTNLE